jgi:hypothetical protein
MKDGATRLAEDALTLQSAAEGLHENALDRDFAPLVPAALTVIEDTLRTLSRTCYGAAHAFVPLGEHGESVTERYGRAAEQWPTPRDGRGPSYEQQARVLASLHDAGAALRTAAGHCGRAGDNLAGTMESTPALYELRRSPRSSEAA